MRKILVLASGGLDSTVLAVLYQSLGYEVHLMYIKYGQVNEEKELNKLYDLMDDFDISPEDNLHLSKISMAHSTGGCLDKDNPNPYVEMRNLVFLSHAVSLAESLKIDKVAIGFISTAGNYPDATEQFLADMNIMSLNSAGIEILAPLIHLNKAGVYKLGHKLGVSLLDTHSCNYSGGEPCGQCVDCVDILKLIKDCNIPDSENPFKI